MNSHGASATLASAVRDLLRSLEAPALGPFLADWPAAAERGGAETAAEPVAAPLAALRWLDDLAGEPQHFAAPVVAGLCRHARSLRWRQTYSVSDVGDEFLRNYAWTEILGPRATITARRIACGFLLLGPSTFYPEHRHEAEEIYVPLRGCAGWRQGDGVWRDRPPGAVIHHASEERHSMRTDGQPLLALYVWRSDHLHQKARLEPGHPSPTQP